MFVCTLQALLYVFATFHIEDARLHHWQFGQAPEIYFAGRTHNPNANRIGKDSERYNCKIWLLADVCCVFVLLFVIVY